MKKNSFLTNMQFRAHDIFPRLEPYRVVADLGIQIEQKNDLFFTPHPRVTNRLLQIESNEFVGHADGPTPACNVLDFLALHFGSYGEAVDYVIDRYHNLASMPTGVSLDSVRDQLVESSKAAREQFEAILALREPLRTRSTKLLGGYLYCRRKELDLRHIWRMLYIVRGDDLNVMLQSWLGGEEAFEAGECYLICPYFKNRHTFGLLEILTLEEKHLRTVHLNPTQHMFFGLHTCFPDNHQTRVVSAWQAAAQRYSRAMENGDFRTGVVQVQFNPNGEPNREPALRSGLFQVTKDTDFNTLVKHRAAFEDLEIIDPGGRFAAAPKPVAWRQYGINSVIKALNEDPKDEDRVYSLRTSGMIESLRDDAEVFPALLQHLEKHNGKSVLGRIRRQRGGQELFILRGIHVAESPTGYVATKPGTNLYSQFTNFVIKIDSRIWFEESEESYLSGRVLMHGEFVPLLLSDAQMHQPKAILLQAQRAVNRAAIPHLPLPTVTDAAHQGKLVSIISHQIINAPKIIGIQRLGWNNRKDGFIAPVWQARSLGLEPTSKAAHPESAILARFFSFLDYKVVDDFSQVPSQARSLIALVVASLVRGFLNQQTTVIRILRNPQSFALLQCVFRPLGQVAPIELSPNRKLARQTLSIENFSNYPIFATCPEMKALEGINYPIFLLCKSGLALSEPTDSQTRLRITSLSHRVITAVVLSLIRDPGQAQALSGSEEMPPLNELAFQGKRAIEASGGIERFDLLERELPLLEKA